LEKKNRSTLGRSMSNCYKLLVPYSILQARDAKAMALNHIAKEKGSEQKFSPVLYGHVEDMKFFDWFNDSKAIFFSGLNYNEIAVRCYLASCMYAGTANPSMPEIAAAVGASESTVRAAIKGLVEKGWLIKNYEYQKDNEKVHTANSYLLIIPGGMSKQIKNDERQIIQTEEMQVVGGLELSKSEHMSTCRTISSIKPDYIPRSGGVKYADMPCKMCSGVVQNMQTNYKDITTHNKLHTSPYHDKKSYSCKEHVGLITNENDEKIKGEMNPKSQLAVNARFLGDEEKQLVNEVVKAWNKHGITNRALSENMQKRLYVALKKALESYSLQEIIDSIDIYSRAYKAKLAKRKYILIHFIEKGFEYFLFEENWKIKKGPWVEKDYEYQERERPAKGFFSFMNDDDSFAQVQVDSFAV